MKKYNLYLWLAVLVGLFASCSQDENAMLQTNESNRVSLTAELPDDFAQIGTRSVPSAPGEYKLRCILEVWSSDLNKLIVRQEAAPGGIEDITFNFKLEQTGEYKALLWADYIPSNTEALSTTIANIDVLHFADEYYTTNSGTGLQAVARIKGETTNPDRLDAFFACESFTKPATALNNLSATLARPFTKLTIAEKNSENFGYCQTVLAKATIPTQINVATGEVSEPQETMMWNAAPSGAEITVGGSACKTLFSTYILATTDGTMSDIKLEFTGASGKTLKNVTIPTGVPAKRNHRVNAAGNLIQAEDEPSSDAQMKVDINANWSDDSFDINKIVWDGENATEPKGYNVNEAGTVNITSAAELAWLAKECNNKKDFTGYTFNLTTDIDLNKHEWTPIGNTLVNRFKGNFNGQGHTVRNMKVNIECENVIFAGLFGCVEGSEDNPAKVSNLIVEGNVKGVSTAYSVYAGGICSRAVFVDIEFCRFNGTVSGSASDQNSVYSGGIAGNYLGNKSHSLTCCISDATVTAGGIGTTMGGGLVGQLVNSPVTYSAWNSSGIEDGVGTGSSGESDETSPKPFTTIAELNRLLDDMNGSKSGSEYKWKAGDNTNTAYPILVKRTPSGTN